MGLRTRTRFRLRPCCRLHTGGDKSTQQDEDLRTGVTSRQEAIQEDTGFGGNVIKMDKKAVTDQEGLEKQDKATPNPHSGAARVRGDGAREENLSRDLGVLQNQGQR